MRIGGKETVLVDVRIVAATHRDLEREIAEGMLRSDARVADEEMVSFAREPACELRYASPPSPRRVHRPDRGGFR